MRLPLIAPAHLSPEQRPIYEDMRAGIEKSFQGFKSIADKVSSIVRSSRMFFATRAISSSTFCLAALLCWLGRCSSKWEWVTSDDCRVCILR